MSNPAKKAMREKLGAIIGSLSKEEKRRQSEKILEKVLASPAYKSAQRVSVYLSTSGEVDTLPLISNMFSTKKRVFVPTYNKNVMEMVELRDLDDYESLPLTKWNIKQPKISDNRPNAMDCGLDLILTPGVAFSTTGGRLGHGMGYYDKFLTRFFEKYPRKNTQIFALGFQEQIVPDLPTEPTDFTLDGVISP